jgi:hypothetical protein
MSVGNLINEYGNKHSPYLKGLVNHLPMAQLALYKMSQDLEKVKDFTETYVKGVDIDPVKTDYIEINSIEECLGKRELYESCLDIIREEIKEKNIDEIIRYVLNAYPFGMSSGLFHTSIRLAYGVEGFKMEKELSEEVARALAYYITAYRKADIFERRINPTDILQELDRLINNEKIREILQSKATMGQKIKALYESEDYMKLGFLIDGDEDEKINALLQILLPTYINSGSIVILHCITGLHALLVLKEYYNDFDTALDIMTTCVITHLLTNENLMFTTEKDRIIDFSWNYILSMCVESTDVHTLKFAYSCRELYKRNKIIELKKAAKKRIIRY